MSPPLNPLSLPFSLLFSVPFSAYLLSSLPPSLALSISFFAPQDWPWLAVAMDPLTGDIAVADTNFHAVLLL